MLDYLCECDVQSRQSLCLRVYKAPDQVGDRVFLPLSGDMGGESVHVVSDVAPPYRRCRNSATYAAYVACACIAALGAGVTALAALSSYSTAAGLRARNRLARLRSAGFFAEDHALVVKQRELNAAAATRSALDAALVSSLCLLVLAFALVCLLARPQRNYRWVAHAFLLAHTLALVVHGAARCAASSGPTLWGALSLVPLAYVLPVARALRDVCSAAARHVLPVYYERSVCAV